jgi:hypothetical protein
MPSTGGIKMVAIPKFGFSTDSTDDGGGEARFIKGKDYGVSEHTDEEGNKYHLIQGEGGKFARFDRLEDFESMFEVVN